jgi:hypothetical protein
MLEFEDKLLIYLIPLGFVQSKSSVQKNDFPFLQITARESPRLALN